MGIPGPHARHQSAKLDEREIRFLANYFGKDSPTKGNGVKSATAAGYPKWTATTKWPSILKKYEDCSFRASAKAVGITKPYLAFRLKQILETGGDKDILAAIRLVLANLGEATDSSGGNVSINSGGAPVMVIVGATADRMKRLKGGANGLTPQLGRPPKMRTMGATPEEREEAKEAYDKYLDSVKVLNAEAQVSDIDKPNDPPSGEAPTSEG